MMSYITSSLSIDPLAWGNRDQSSSLISPSYVASTPRYFYREKRDYDRELK